jgi:hypothetical protein
MKDYDHSVLPRLVKLTAITLAFCSAPISLKAETDKDTGMSFFITSTNMGGGDLGGLSGADNHCAELAKSAGTNGKTWKAYLSTSSVDARDRIGAGPWHNANGDLVALSLTDLHYSNMSFLKATALNESGEVVNGATDDLNQHDILTGTNADGTGSGLTCEDWTSASASEQATVGHHDRVGGGPMPTSWNSSHSTQGCSVDALSATGSSGYFYCFAE